MLLKRVFSKTRSGVLGIKNLIFFKLKCLLVIQVEMQVVYLICESEVKERAVNYR